MNYLKNSGSKMNFPTSSECQNALYKQRLQESKNYKKVFSNSELDEILHSQQELLRNCILSNAKQSFFNVFNMSCSSGKTYTAVNCMPEYLNQVESSFVSNNGVLFVIRQTQECDDYAEYLNSLFRDETTNHYREVALAYHSKKYANERIYR